MTQFVIVRKGAIPHGLVIDGHKLPGVLSVTLLNHPGTFPTLIVEIAILREDEFRFEQTGESP